MKRKPVSELLSGYVSHILQSLAPFSSILLCFSTTFVLESHPKISCLFPHIRWIYSIEDGHHDLSHFFLTLQNLQQLIQTSTYQVEEYSRSFNCRRQFLRDVSRTRLGSRKLKKTLNLLLEMY